MSEMTWMGVTFTGVTHDNRKVEPGDLFFAFPGERFDGHDFVTDALRKGAVAAVVSRDVPDAPEGATLVRVEDTVKAYGELAAWYRAQFAIPVVGITGSVGKTTTKDMIASVLSVRFNTLATRGNLNNHIGLPQTVLSLSKDTEAAVLEMGMNHLGEISYLTKIARPTIATITNVGDAHIGLLGSRENIFKAKREIFEGLAPDGFIALNVDDEYLARILEDKSICEGRTVVTIGESESAMLRAVDIKETQDGISFVIEGDCPAISSAVRREVTVDAPNASAVRHETTSDVSDTIADAGEASGVRVEKDAAADVRRVHVPLPGHHIIYPTLTAYAIGRHLGMTHAEIVQGLAAVTTSGKRMEITTRENNVTILNDTYNANPQSMKAAIDTLAKREGVKKIAVLGDMFELGDDAVRLHEEVGAYAAASDIDVLVTVGTLSAHMAQAARGADSRPVIIECPDKDTAREKLAPLITHDCAVLFKASRGMALEDMIE